MKKTITILTITLLFSGFMGYKGFKNIKHNEKEYTIVNLDDNEIITQSSMNFLLKTEGLSFEAYKGMGRNELAICYGNNFKEYLNLFHQNCTIHYDLLKRCIISKNVKLCQRLPYECQDIGATEKECDTVLQAKVQLFLSELQKENLELNNKQYEALISLIYNLKNNFSAFVKSNLYQHIKYNTDSFDIKTYSIISEWLDFSRVKEEVTCSIVERRIKEVIAYYSEHTMEEKEIAYATLLSILKDNYSGCKFIENY